MVLKGIHIILFVLMILVIVQDLRKRAIHILLPVFIFVLAMIRFVMLEKNWTDLLINFFFLALMMAGLIFYISIKRRKLTNPLENDFGLGDLLFFIAIIPLFSEVSYMVFVISGLLFSIVCHIVNHLITRTNTIPLAGYLAAYLILFGTFWIYAPNKVLTIINRFSI